MMKQSKPLFTNKDLKKLIFPLFMEQLLTMLVGITDVFIVSFVGEAAVSGVSLVNVFKGIVFWFRFRQNKWKQFKVI